MSEDGPIMGVALRLPSGRVWTAEKPHRHGDLIALMNRHEARADVAAAEQGFYLEDYSFVGRAEAMQIAKAAGQIRTTRVVDGIERTHEPVGNELYSEDLW